MTESATVYREDTFKKMSEKAIDLLTDEGDALAIALFTIIVRHVNRQKNQLVATFDQLAEWSGMSAKSVQRRTKILEKLGIIRIVRRKKGDKNAPNEYRLAGIAYTVACETVSPSKQTESPVERTESPSLTYIHKKDKYDDDISKFSDSDTGEFSVEAEGIDSTLDLQDINEFEEQIDFLENCGVKGAVIHQHKSRGLHELENMWNASEVAERNRTGFFLSLLNNGLFEKKVSEDTGSYTHNDDDKYYQEIMPDDWKRGYNLLREFRVNPNDAYEFAYKVSEDFDLFDCGWRLWIEKHPPAHIPNYLLKMLRDKKRPPFWTDRESYTGDVPKWVQEKQREEKQKQEDIKRMKDKDYYISGKWASIIEH